MSTSDNPPNEASVVITASAALAALEENEKQFKLRVKGIRGDIQASLRSRLVQSLNKGEDDA